MLEKQMKPALAKAYSKTNQSIPEDPSILNALIPQGDMLMNISSSLK